MNGEFSKSAWLQALRHSSLFRGIALVVSWLLVWELGSLVEYIEHASVWFPAAGLTYAALLIAGTRALLPLMLSAILITLWTGNQYHLSLSFAELLYAGILFGIAHITPYYIGAKMLRLVAKQGNYGVPLLIIFFLVSAALMTLLATFLVTGSLVISKMMPVAEIAKIWLPFWIGDLAGVIVLAPLFAGLLSLVYPKPQFALVQYVGINQFNLTPTFTYKILTTLLMVTICMALAKWSDSPESAFAIFFLVIPHMWIASTESAFFTTLSLAASSFFIALLVNVFGLMDYVMVYQFAINVVAANALFAIALPAMAEDNRILREMVITDTLTQAASRDHFIKCAMSAVIKSHKTLEPLSLIVFDIDNFKQVNDQYGHSQGDMVLRKISYAAKVSLRPNDLLGRYGGDEFVVLLPNASLGSAQAIAQRILDEASQIAVNEHKISSSYGIAELNSGENFATLFERADQALYAAKQGGRNRIVTRTIA